MPEPTSLWEIPDPNGLEHVISLQGFDARIESSRDIFTILGWSSGKVRRRYNLEMIFDGGGRGLEEVLADYGGSAIVVGKSTVSVGVDTPVVIMSQRRVSTNPMNATDFISSTAMKQRLTLVVNASPGQRMGPFSLRQQLLYAADISDHADISDLPIYCLYGVRVRWPVDAERVQEECLILLAVGIDDAADAVCASLRVRHPHLDLRSVTAEVDDSRLEFVADGVSLFNVARVSSLNEDQFAEKFGLRSD